MEAVPRLTGVVVATAAFTRAAASNKVFNFIVFCKVCVYDSKVCIFVSGLIHGVMIRDFKVTLRNYSNDSMFKLHFFSVLYVYLHVTLTPSRKGARTTRVGSFYDQYCTSLRVKEHHCAGTSRAKKSCTSRLPRWDRSECRIHTKNIENSFDKREEIEQKRRVDKTGVRREPQAGREP